MNFKESNIKKISCLLIISVLTINFSFIQKANAQFVVTDPTLEFAFDAYAGEFIAYDAAATTYFTSNQGTASTHLGESVNQDIWTVAKQAALVAGEAVLRNLARRLIQQITEKTVDWIQGGFKGNPAYVSQPLKFLVNTADATVGDMIFNDPDLNFLCSPFQIQVKLALGFSFQTFRSRINCTLSGVVNNVQNAARGASATINIWDNWIQTTTSAQNTPIGAYLIAQGELNARMGNVNLDLTNELNRGLGSLTYQECSEDRTDKSGNTETIKYKGSRFYQNQNRDYNQYTYSNVKCETRTPGAVITDMLGFKATSDGRVNELTAALGDGIDTIFTALADTLLKKALAQLTNGVLGTNNSSEEVQYNLNLSNLSSQAQANYNTDINSINASGRTNPTNIFAQYNSIFSPSSTSSLSNNAIGGTSFAGSTTTSFSQGFGQYSYTANNIISSTNPIDALKANALSGINYYLNAEATYQSTLIFASSTLSAARIIFVTARNCNVGYNTWPSILRADLINSNVIKNIDGIVYTDSFRTLAQIPWNLTSINNWINTSNSNISILNTAQSIVSAATTQVQITDAMTPVNSTSFNTDPQKDMVTNIKTWLRGVRDIYSTIQCPINLDKVLAATSTSALGY